MFAIVFFLTFHCFMQQRISADQNTGVYENDRINVLPGVPFNYNFGQFAGFLNASNDIYQHYLHYWLLESQSDPDKDPVVVWFNGGPGSSSINSLLWQVGPFHVNKDGKTLFENVFAWNKAANLLAIDSPAGVGWSFAVDGNINTTDEQVRDDSFRALVDFFSHKFPKFRNNDFYLAGLSYAGIYIPMLAAKIVNEHLVGRFPTNLTGIAIENGWLSHRFYKSSLLHFLYYHGIAGYDDGSECGDLIKLNADTWLGTTLIDTFNIYEDCYEPTFNLQMVLISEEYKAKHLERLRKLRQNQLRARKATSTNDIGKKINYDSTDPWAGYYCWDGNTDAWMNLPDVKQAMHVTAKQMKWNVWPDGIDYIYNHFYHFTQYEMDPYFYTIIQNSSTKILIYNGDIDTQCDFMMARKFKTMKRQPWYYRGQIAGYWEQFQETLGYKKIDLRTVKGSGHFAGYSRPGPALQMIMNLILNSNDYSKPLPDYISTTLRPLNDGNGNNH